MQEHGKSEQLETPQKFRVDPARLTESDLKWLKSDRPTKFEAIDSYAYFMTGEEHTWVGSTWPLKCGYPRTPAALILFPDKLDTINEKRKERGEMQAANSFYISPNLREAGYMLPLLSLRNLIQEPVLPKIFHE